MKTNFLPQLQMDFSGGIGEESSPPPMKPKTFEELFEGTGIEPTKDENGGVHYNFNATLKTNNMKLKNLILINPLHIELHQSGRGEFPDSYKITNEGVKAIGDAVSSDDELIQYIRRETGMNKTDIKHALIDSKEEIGVIISNWYRANGKKTS